jgi:hypothetical protein
MDFSRIESAVSVEALKQKHVTMVGGAYRLIDDLAKCGVGGFSIVDFDCVSPSNVARQDFNSTHISRRKVEVAAERLHKTNPDIETETHILNYCALSEEDHDRLFGHTDLFIYSADSFLVDARGNRESIRLGKPSLFIGLYPGGRASEIIYWYPGLTPACYRCICASRYQAFANGQGNVSSNGSTIFDLRMVDSVAGQIALGLLTHGADNRYGRLLSKLGNRNLLQTKIDPDYLLAGKDIFRKYLGNHPANFSFTTIALPMEREPNCPDCSALYDQPTDNSHD